MSAPYTAIRAALTARLQTLASLPPVAWENVAYTPTLGTTFLKPSLLPAEPFQAEIGAAGQNMHVGVYQVSIFAPAGTGMAHQTLRDSICDLFKRGVTLTYGGVTVTCVKAYPGAMLQETDWIQIPIIVVWRSYAAN